MGAHFNSEHDMTSAVERRTHRAIPVPHQQNWSDQQDDGPLDAAAGIFRAVVLSGVAWIALAAVLVVVMGW